ncbi:1,2-phenylacetyl-CoA epoxidase subunit PaaC [Lederbergia citrea]|uniref:Phenylacetate-CoA oxygenase subunit PaaC n=1 Tax=Lederbergia citrea TaxID=2833581 RepID=A0A942UGT4_9BACI|nr:1,2-phenylacetyl-CoA epoxidase subunit PaaC [Lederbergia citrea]MBS4177575.1 phenylacetate-CoA oxygenase subunit PaaC [Lederbergia citrea]MBS4204249.1 phenylacetate-CoA oxygenase subunit PaaC [Lederbergia citrea]MBS4221166.1 phenylacetate-CoA oxygenase subunit PaaC [Lederbergia citrea]
MAKITSALEASSNKEYRNALVELLFQLADDEFLIAFRGSEWLGLAPHIEEDVAFSSINQNTMGHAAMYYRLLEELGEGDADELAHARKAFQRKNAVLLELVNGTGTYLEEPRFDWAFAVVRHYFYDVYKKLKLEALKQSSYEPLVHVAININMEQYYHVMHWRTWFEQLCEGKGSARARMEAAIEKVWDEFSGVLDYGPKGGAMSGHGIIIDEASFQKRWETEMRRIFDAVNMSYPGQCRMKSGNGRIGEHTKDLEQAISTLGEVYHLDPQAVW